MAIAFIDPSVFNKVVYEVANAMNKEIKDEKSFERVSARIMEQAGVPEGSRAEVSRQLPGYWRYNYLAGAGDVRQQVLKLLVPDGNARKKALNLEVGRAIDQASFHDNLDSLLALVAKPAAGAPAWVFETAKEMETLLSKLEGLASWSAVDDKDQYKRDRVIDLKDAGIVSSAYKTTTAEAFRSLQESARLEPAVFDAWNAFSAAAKDKVIDAAALEQAAHANLDGRLAGIGKKERRAIDDAPVFFVARESQAATGVHSKQFHAALVASYPALAAEWAQVPEQARYAAQQLAGTPKGIAALPAKSLSDLAQLLDHVAKGTMALEQLRPALSALVEQVKDRGYIKTLTALAAAKDLGPELLRLHAGLRAAGELGLKLDEKVSTKALEQMTKNWLGAIPKGEISILGDTGVYATLATLVKTFGADKAELTASITRALAEGTRKGHVSTKETGELIHKSEKDDASRPFAVALSRALIDEVITSQKEPKSWYWQFDDYRPNTRSMIPRAVWEPILTELGAKHSAQSPEGVAVVNALSMLDRTNWVEEKASEFFLNLNAGGKAADAGGAEGLELLKRAFLDGKHTVLESASSLQGFGRDGSNYYTAEDAKVWKTDANTGKREQYLDLEKWRARAIRAGGDHVVILADLGGAGWIAVHDKDSGEKLRRRALPRPINHAANTSAAIAPDGRIVFPESKYGKADYIVALSPEFDKNDIAFDHQTAPRGFKSELVAIHGDHVFAAFRNHGKQQLQIMRYDLPYLSNGKEMVGDLLRLGGYKSSEAMWFVGDKVFVSDLEAVHVLAMDGDTLKPAGALPLKSVRDAMPRADGGLDLVIGLDAFEEKGKGSRLISLSKEETQAIFG